jgi:hypothetical protein
MRNEKTSGRVAKIAGRVLAGTKRAKDKELPVYLYTGIQKCSAGFKATFEHICSAGELQALAASALTQTADKPRSKKK